MFQFRQIEQLEYMLRGETDKNEDAKIIMSLTGFDAYGALLVATSIDDIEWFDNPKSLVSFMGLCRPCPKIRNSRPVN